MHLVLSHNQPPVSPAALRRLSDQGLEHQRLQRGPPTPGSGFPSFSRPPRAGRQLRLIAGPRELSRTPRTQITAMTCPRPGFFQAAGRGPQSRRLTAQPSAAGREACSPGAGAGPGLRPAPAKPGPAAGRAAPCPSSSWVAGCHCGATRAGRAEALERVRPDPTDGPAAPWQRRARENRKCVTQGAGRVCTATNGAPRPPRPEAEAALRPTPPAVGAAPGRRGG